MANFASTVNKTTLQRLFLKVKIYVLFKEQTFKSLDFNIPLLKLQIKFVLKVFAL